jgi:hypothetical protein
MMKHETQSVPGEGAPVDSDDLIARVAACRTTEEVDVVLREAMSELRELRKLRDMYLAWRESQGGTPGRDPIEAAGALRLERRDMLAAWLLTRQREGVKVVSFDEPQLEALMKLCADAEAQVLRSIGEKVSRIRNETGEQK